ncbi:MAG: fibronectin type III domain-containing protein [Candidatus Eiseniibacteriota bacterium]
MEARFRARALTLAVALATGGCGHSTEALAPYDDASAVPAPRALAASLDDVGSVVLAWSATSDDRVVVDGWTVERRPTESPVFVRLTDALLADTTFTDLLAEDGRRYVYRVVAVTGAGVESAPAETPPIRADRTGPTTPTDLTVTPLSGALEIAFVPGPEPDVALFEVRVTPVDPARPALFLPVTGSPAVLDGLASGASYGVSVAAIDSAGRQSPFSTPDVIGTPARRTASASE